MNIEACVEIWTQIAKSGNAGHKNNPGICRVEKDPNVTETVTVNISVTVTVTTLVCKCHGLTRAVWHGFVHYFNKCC